MSFLDLITGKRAAALTAQAGDLPLATWEESGELTRVVLSDLYGFTPGTEWRVSRKDALSVGSVAKSRHLMTGKIAAFPLVDMVNNSTAPRPAAWVQQLEAGTPRVSTVRWIVDGMMFYGRAWLIVSERYADGSPLRFRLVPEHRATVDSNGRLTRAFGEKVNPLDVVRIDGPHEGILNTSQRILRNAIKIEAAASRAADNPVPSVELHQTTDAAMSDDEIDALVDGWAAARRGQNGGVAYTSSAIEAKTHGAAAEQLLIAGRNTAAVEVARALGLPAWAVDATLDGSGSSMTYSSVPARSRELIEYGLEPYMDAITARLSMDDVLPAGRWVRFDTTQLTRGSFAERMAGYKSAIDAGIYTADECRGIENGIPQEGKQ